MIKDIESPCQVVSTPNSCPIHHALLVMHFSSLSSLVAGNHDVHVYHECNVLLLHVTSPAGRVWKLYGSPATPVYVEGVFQVCFASLLGTRRYGDSYYPHKTLDRTREGSHTGYQILSSRLGHRKHCQLHTSPRHVLTASKIWRYLVCQSVRPWK
ncbi:hypothetical protein BDN67DRAFT_679656 [Paxillus ammoniavirescens]|nr:hypothetical protein BDN67DRAFT_679656 [Paxillus ammoniavirescens]